MRDQGFLEQTGLDAELVKVTGPAKNLEGILNNEADLCTISATNPMPNIAEGSPAKIIGSAMKLTALSAFSANPDIKTMSDLVGRTVGIGPRNFLLHITMVALLRKRGIDDSKVKFVEIGSNAQVFQAVAAGKIDAGPSSVVSFYYQDKLGVHSLTDANMWTELPEYTYQFMYASDRAIKDNREAVVRTLAAYAKLFRFMQSPNSWDAYSKARTTALPKNDAEESQAVWKFMQEQKPYGSDLAIPDGRMSYMQDLLASVDAIKTKVAIEKLADMSMAHDAMKMLG
jgi:ABC-type nitrate/sulfonate/bicarbonate transport system substrate-binding protein